MTRSIGGCWILIYKAQVTEIRPTKILVSEIVNITINIVHF